MAHLLQVTDGTTTINLTTSGWTLKRYDMAVGDPNEDSKPITDTIELQASGASTTAMQTTLETLEQMLLKVRLRRKTNRGPRIYLQIQPISDATLWQSEILAWSLPPSQGALAYWINAKMEVRLIVERRPYWESATLTELNIKSQNNATAGTGGRPVHNRKDGIGGNYVEIASSQIDGSLPAPVKVQLTNTSGSFQNYRNIHLATNSQSDPVNFTHFIDCETLASGSAGSSVTSGSANAGGYATVTFTGAATLKWTLSSTLLAKSAGRSFRLLARFVGYSTAAPIYAEPRIMDDGGLADIPPIGDKVTLPVLAASPYALVDLGSLFLPPGGYNTIWAPQLLALKLYSSISQTVAIDYIQLTPTESYRKLVQTGQQIANNDSIVDDGIERQTYALEGGLASPFYAPQGEPLMIFPGQTNRIYILHDTGMSSPLTNTFSVRLWYRPRRNSL